MEYNDIKVAGAKALGGALTTNKSLTSLKYVATRPLAPRVTDTKVSAVDTLRTRSFLMPAATPVRFVDGAHVLMSDGWIVRGTHWHT